MMTFEVDLEAADSDAGILAAYSATTWDAQVTVIFHVDYGRWPGWRSSVQVRRDYKLFTTTNPRDWPAIEAVLPRRFWPTDIHHTAEGGHPQLSAFERQAYELAKDHFASLLPYLD